MSSAPLLRSSASTPNQGYYTGLRMLDNFLLLGRANYGWQGSESVRLSGVCTSAARYTLRQVPFALMLRSAGDVVVEKGPPWLSARHLLAVGILLIFLAFLAILLYIRAEH